MYGRTWAARAAWFLAGVAVGIVFAALGYELAADWPDGTPKRPPAPRPLRAPAPIGDWGLTGDDE